MFNFYNIHLLNYYLKGGRGGLPFSILFLVETTQSIYALLLILIIVVQNLENLLKKGNLSPATGTSAMHQSVGLQQSPSLPRLTRTHMHFCFVFSSVREINVIVAHPFAYVRIDLSLP